jgi:hypothetical protein
MYFKNTEKGASFSMQCPFCFYATKVVKFSGVSTVIYCMVMKGLTYWLFAKFLIAGFSDYRMPGLLITNH